MGEPTPSAGPGAPPVPDGVSALPGTGAVLAAHGPALPQPDQLCGPFSARAALHALVADPPSVVDLARAAGTLVLPVDEPAWRPPGAPPDRSGWDDLPRAAGTHDSGTRADHLAAGVEALLPEVAAVPVLGASLDAGRLRRLLTRLAGRRRPVAVLANLRTGPVSPLGAGWDVGHVVVLWGLTDDGEVALADTYRELTAPGWPPGCRPVAAGAAVEALAERGLLLLCDAAERPTVEHLVDALDLTTSPWST